MHSLLITSLIMLAASCVLEAAPNSPNDDEHPAPGPSTVPLPGIITFHVQIDVLNEKFHNAVLRSLGGIRHPIIVDMEANKFSVDWTKCNVAYAANLEHIVIGIQSDRNAKPEGHFDPVYTVVLPKEEFGKFFAGGDAEIVIKPVHAAGFIDHKITYLNGLPGTLKFTVDHRQLGKENALEYMTIVAKFKMIPCKHTIISMDPPEFSVNWADSKCVEKFKDMEDVQIQFKFKQKDEQVSFYRYTPMLRHLYAGGEVKITLYAEDKDKPKLEYVKYPNGANVPKPGILFFNVELESRIERFQYAYIPGCKKLIKGKGSNFIVDWSQCDVVDEDDLQNLELKLECKKPGQINPTHTIYFKELSKEKLKHLFVGGEGKIVVHEDDKATTELTVLDIAKNVETTKKAGTITFSVNFKQIAKGVHDFHVKSIQTMHRLFGECKSEMYHSNKDSAVKFSVNWADCHREVLGHYNLLDIKFRLDFSHGKPRFVDLANYSHNLLKHMYAGGEAEIVMHRNEKQKPSLSYLKYPTGLSVQQPKLLTINVEMENKLERFKNASISMMPGECNTIKGDGPTFIVEWSQCEVVEAGDLEHFEFGIEGVLNPKPEGKADRTHKLYFEQFSKETLKQLFDGGEAKIVIRDGFGAKHELTYLNSPNGDDESAIKAGTMTFIMDYENVFNAGNFGFIETKKEEEIKNVHVKGIQILHRLLGECKTEMHDSSKEFTVKFTVNWAQCQREVLGAYNLLDVKFQFEFSHGKPRLIELAKYSNSLRKHMYAGGEAQIVMYKDEGLSTKKTTITYVKYPNGSDVPRHGTLTINLQIENKKESFKKAVIFKPNGESSKNIESRKLPMDWADYDVVEADDLRHFWLYIHGEMDFGAEKMPDKYIPPVHAIGFVDLSKEELGHLFAGGEAKLLIRDTANGPKPTLFLNMNKPSEFDRLRSLSFGGPYEIQDNWAYKKPVPKSVTKQPGPLHFNMNYDKVGPNVHFESVKVMHRSMYMIMTECEVEVVPSSQKHNAKFTVTSWTRCAPNIKDMKRIVIQLTFAKLENGGKKTEFVHKSDFWDYPSTLLEHFYVGGEANLEVFGFDEGNSVVTYVKHPSGMNVKRPGILTIHVCYENTNEHFHSADIVGPEGFVRTAHNGKKAFYANWNRLQLVEAEDLRNFHINVYGLLANKADGLVHPMHTVWFKHLTTTELEQFYNGGEAFIGTHGNKLPVLTFSDHSKALIDPGIPHPGTMTFHLEFENKKQTLVKAQIHSQFGFFEAENGSGPDPSFNLDWSKTGVVFEEEIGKATIYIIVTSGLKTNPLVYKIALNELQEEMRKQFYAGGVAKILIRDNQAHEGQIVIKPEDITILNGQMVSGASASELHHVVVKEGSN